MAHGDVGPVCSSRGNKFSVKTSVFFRGFSAYASVVNLTEQMTQMARQAKAASRELARLTTTEKNACLPAMAAALEQNATAIKQANALDTEAAAKHGLSSAMLDRLKLDDKRISAMARGLREVAALPDPVGQILDERVRPNGLEAAKNFHAHRRHRHHLRIASKCDRGRGGPVFQIRQRHHPARRQGGDELESTHRPHDD